MMQCPSYLPSMRRIITILIILFLNLLYIPQVFAQEEGPVVIERNQWKADENVVFFKEDYNFPNKVIIVLLEESINNDEIKEVRELFYYFSTRSLIGDLPFQYLITSSGSVYRGNKYNDEAKISLGDITESVFIAYIINGSKELSISAVNSLKDIVLQVVNNYAVSIDNIYIKKFAFDMGEKSNITSIELVDADSSWSDNLSMLKESIKEKYSPRDIKYKVEITNVNVPSESQDPTKTCEIKLTLKNTGDTNIYSGSGSNIYMTRNKPFDAVSLFHINEEWDSFSRVGLLNEGEQLGINEEKEFTLKIYIPLYPPEKSEDFILVDPKGDIIEDTDFKIILKIKDIEGIIIEITDTPIGYLNVRKTPGFGEVITKVSSGERFVVLEYKDGYYKIEANGQTGWVVNTYVKVI